MQISKNVYEEALYEQISKWLVAYSKTKNKYQKSKYMTLIVTRMYPIIRRIAKTIARRSYDPVEDLVQAGSIGLLRAIENYVISSGVDFRIYAGRTIIGTMKHYLRDKMNAIRVPRHVYELLYRINTFTSTLTQEQLYDLTSEEVAMALNVPTEVIDYAMEADRRTSVLSLEDLFNNSYAGQDYNYEEYIAQGDYKEHLDIEDTKLLLKNIIKNLPEPYKKLVELYYYNDMRQSEIAEELNMSQMTVSRKMKKAFAMLYKELAKTDLHEIYFNKGSY